MAGAVNEWRLVYQTGLSDIWCNGKRHAITDGGWQAGWPKEHFTLDYSGSYRMNESCYCHECDRHYKEFKVRAAKRYKDNWIYPSP